MIKSILLHRYLVPIYVLIAVFFPILSGVAVMKYDAVDLYLPWKYFISECIRNGELPLWNPYINNGFPQMGDPGTWYPISWLFGLFHGYTFQSLHLEFIFHLYIAAIGFQLFLKQYTTSNLILISFSCAYMLSGFMIGNAQHLGWIVGAAWLPWVIFSFRSIVYWDRNKAYIFPISFFFMFSGGYPAITFITCYILLAYLGKSIYFNWKGWNVGYRWIFLKRLAFIAILTFIVILPVAIASSELAMHVTRGEGLQRAKGEWNLLEGSLNWNAVSTIFLPLLSLKKDYSFWGTDISMVNCSFGVLNFFILIIGVLVYKPRRITIYYLLLGGLFFLLAMGQIFPFRQWISYFPLLDLFRFPSVFRLFGILFLLLSSGIIANDIFIKEYPVKRLKLITGITVFVLFVSALIACVYAERWRFLKMIDLGWVDFINHAGQAEFIFLQAILSLFLFSTLLIILFWKSNYFYQICLCVSLFEMLLTSSLLLPATVISHDSMSYASKGMNLNRSIFSPPSLTKNLSEFSDEKQAKHFSYLWRNLSFFTMQPTSDGYSPYSLNSSEQVARTGRLTEMQNSPFIYLESDSLNRSDLKWRSFSPNRMILDVQAVGESNLLVLNQNRYPNWSVRVNGLKKVVHYKYGNYPAVELTTGSSVVEFFIEVTYFRICLIISWVVMSVIFLYELYWFFKNKKNGYLHR